MLNLRLRLGKDDGTIDAAKSRVLETLDITVTTALNTPSNVTFSVSRDTFVPEQYPFVVILEQSVDGGPYVRPPYYSTYIVEKDNDDSKDPGKVSRYEGIDFATWLIQGGLVSWSNSAKDGKRTWYEPGNKPASAGYVLHGMLTELKSSVWFPALSWTFNGSKDSAGNTWLAEDKNITAWELLKNLSEVLGQMTDDGMCEWSTSDVKLNMYRMGQMGEELPDVVLGGRGFSSVPVALDASGLYSHIRAVPDDLPWQNFYSNFDLIPRFGHRSIVLTQSGIKDVASSRQNAQPYIDAGKEYQREEGYEWTPSDNTPHPWRDFNVGDQVTAHSRGGKLLRRVIGIIVNQSGREPAQVTAKVGEMIKSRAAKLKDKIGSSVVGGIAGGSGAGFPQSPGPSKMAPIAPLGVLVTSNTGGWLSDGSAVATVKVQWAQTTEATDGSEIDVEEYEVWSRLPAGELARDIATRSTSVEITSWAPEEQRLFAVRAKATNGQWSAFSDEVAVTPAMPDSIVPSPVENLQLQSNIGSWKPEGPVADITIKWDAVTESTDGSPITVAGYDVWVNGSQRQRSDTASTTYTAASEAVVVFQVRAYTEQGLVGDLSPTLTVTAATPGVSTAKPTPPIMKTGFGMANVRWDGEYIGTANGSMAVSVEREVAGVWVKEGASLTRAGSISIQGIKNEVINARLVAYDGLNRVTGISDMETITIQAIGGDDIDAEDIWANQAWVNELNAGIIRAEWLEPSVGDTLNISANESIQLIVDRQGAQDEDIAQVREDALNALSEAERADALAAEAKSQAQAADGKALVAQSKANDALSQIADQRAVFRVTATGAEIASITGDQKVIVRPDGVVIEQGGAEASVWSAGRLIVSEALVSTLQFGNHVAEPDGNTRTIIRPVNRN